MPAGTKMYESVEHNDRRPDVQDREELRHGRERQVDAAVGTVRLIDIAAEAAAPRRVVDADAVADDRAPVIDVGAVVLADEIRARLLVSHREHAGRRAVSAGDIAGDDGRRDHRLSADGIVKVLRRQVDLDVGKYRRSC